MAKKTVKQEEEGSIDVAKQLGNAEQFLDKNKKAIAVILSLIHI